ncbi:MAG: lipoyl(octanoyl) transferase LipB [Burkholderiaceae bacterium]|nr:lipoyl(octanoyl) transferase LipB [Burkholderiaceae bacterium]
MTGKSAPIIKLLGRVAYEPVFDAMRAFTDRRAPDTPDEIWLVEHDPVFTLGLAANVAHVLDAHRIPLVPTDRGGEVTYHGPGQTVAYLLMDLRRERRGSRLLVREFVHQIEQAVIDTLAEFGIAGERHPGAPGIYIAGDAQSQWHGAKIAALGLKVRTNGCTYHGVSLNVDMDLAPFSWINPCGYQGLAVVDLKTLGVEITMAEAQTVLARALHDRLAT